MVAIIVLALAGAVPVVKAQLAVELKLDRELYIKYEPVRAIVSIRNYSGNALDFGDAQEPRGDLTIILNGEDAVAQGMTERTNVLAGRVLAPGETARFVVTVNALFNLQKPGGYTIAGQVGHQRLRSDYRTKKASFRVSEGESLWRQSIGIPTGPKDGEITDRQVSLLVLHERDASVYCLRIEDAERVYQVIRLGAGILGGEPVCMIDAVSNVHVLTRVKSRLFSYRVFDYGGKQKQKRYYAPVGVMPVLERDEKTGRVRVLGGRFAIEGTDYVLQGDDLEDLKGTTGVDPDKSPGTGPGPGPETPAP